MSDEKTVYSKFSVYLMANPDATKKEFLEETGATVKDWYNTKARVTGLTLRDKGIRLPHSKSIVWLMTNPDATKAEYVRTGFHPDSFIQNCNRAIELLQHCNAARSLIDPLVRTVNLRSKPMEDHPKRKSKVASLLKQPKLDIPKWQPPELLPMPEVSIDHTFDFKPLPLLNPEPYKPFTDSSDIELRVKKSIDEMMTEMREQQQKAETYRARITALNAENFKFRSEISELTEMINGNAV
jgi:hypothetical protein